MSKPWIELKEARGKTVKKMTVAFDPGYNAVEVEFTDGTCMAVDVVPAVKIRPQFQNIKSGDTKILKTYRAHITVAGEVL
jgi:transcription antitermination factor NusG